IHDCGKRFHMLEIQTHERGGPVAANALLAHGSPTVHLPRADDYFEVRFESIGGLGAHAAGQVLATASVVRMGLNGAHFSSYGSEKKGSLIRSYVRLAAGDRPIRTSAPIERPDVIVVFHAALLRSAATFGGLKADGILIYNAPAGVVPAELAALPKKEKSRPNAVMLGTLCTLCPFFDRASVLDTLTEEFAGKHPEAVASNERAFQAGAAEFEQLKGVGTSDGDLSPMPTEPLWGFKTQPAGGVLPAPGNTIWNDLTTSRVGWMPVLDAAKCIHCGVCDLVCPDFCLAWGEADDGGKFERKLKGIDYQYCKGCLRCIESCPTGALAKTAETAGLANKLRVPLFPELIA
ncbi:MAG: 2-oxoacid:acceptor oxidoreductase family protein, partial [Ramlibacter sp.]